MVAGSYAPGAVVSEAARQNDISPQHLFAWRKAAQARLLSLPAHEAPLFGKRFSAPPCNARLDRHDVAHIRDVESHIWLTI
jgi:transposase-like protein